MTRLTCPLQNGSSSALPDFACQISKEQQRLPHTNRGGWFSAEYELSIFLLGWALGIWQYCDTGHDHGHNWQGSRAEPPMTLKRQL